MNTEILSLVFEFLDYRHVFLHARTCTTWFQASLVCQKIFLFHIPNICFLQCLHKRLERSITTGFWHVRQFCLYWKSLTDTQDVVQTRSKNEETMVALLYSLMQFMASSLTELRLLLPHFVLNMLPWQDLRVLQNLHLYELTEKVVLRVPAWVKQLNLSMDGTTDAFMRTSAFYCQDYSSYNPTVANQCKVIFEKENALEDCKLVRFVDMPFGYTEMTQLQALEMRAVVPFSLKASYTKLFPKLKQFNVLYSQTIPMEINKVQMPQVKSVSMIVKQQSAQEMSDSSWCFGNANVNVQLINKYAIVPKKPVTMEIEFPVEDFDDPEPCNECPIEQCVCGLSIPLCHMPCHKVSCIAKPRLPNYTIVCPCCASYYDETMMQMPKSSYEAHTYHHHYDTTREFTCPLPNCEFSCRTQEQELYMVQKQHYQVCPGYEFACPGCGDSIHRSQIALHQQYCAVRQIQTHYIDIAKLNLPFFYSVDDVVRHQRWAKNQ